MAKKNIDTLQPKVVDLTKTGPLSYRQLQALNGGLPAISEDAPDFAMPNPYQGVGDLTYLETGNDFGESAYDTKGLVSQEEFENYEEYRAERQPWYAQLGAGLAKGVVLAGTTFLDGTLGLIFGLRQGIDNLKDNDPNTGFWQGIWDNEFTRATKEFNEQMEKELPNYYTRDELESPWYTNIFTSNFIGDKFIKNLGFSVGALYSGGVWSKALSGLSKGIGLITKSVNAPKMVSTAIGSTMSALNEAKMEALQNSDDWYNTQKLALDNYYKTSLDNALTDEAKLEASEKYEEAMAKLNEDRAKMGNMDMLLNMPILMASNIVQFGKFYANGYKTARKANNILRRAGEYVAEKTPWKGKIAVTKGALSEGLEEISQGAASRISGDYYQTDVQNFYKSRFDPDAEQETLSWMKAFAQGINETVNDGSAWEEFFIGTLTGALGIPGFKKKANGKLGFGINGGAYNEYQEYKEQMAREQEIADRMNERVQSPEFLNYYQGLIRHNKYQGMMNDAADRGDEFDYKNAEHAQFVSDIAMFDNAGKIEDLKTLINEAFDTSDENLDSIIRNTTAKAKNGDLTGPYAKYAQVDPETGEIRSNFGDERSKQEMIDKLAKSKGKMLESINDYIKIKDDIDIRTGQRLTDEQLEELTWMKSQIGNWADRATSVASDVRAAVSNVAGNISQIRDFNAKIRDIEGQNSADLTETYKKADENVRKLDQALQNLEIIKNSDDEGVAEILASHPKFVEGLVQQIKELPQEVMGQESKEDIIYKLNDVVKLGTAAQKYKEKLEEYLKNPEVQVEAQAKAKEQVAEKTKEKSSNAIAQRFDFNKSLGEIADTLEKNMEDIEANGGLEAFMKVLTPEQQKKLKKARNLKKGVDGLRGLVDESSMSDMQKRIADSLIEEAGRNADSIEALGNSLSEALNNGVVAQRVAAALNAKERAGLNDLAVEEAIEDTEAKIREFLDDGLVKAASALEEAEKMSEAKTDKDLEKEAAALEKADKGQEPDLKEPKEKKGPNLNPPSEPKGPKLGEPNEPEEPKEPKGLGGGKPLTPSERVRVTNQKTNERATKAATPVERGKNSQQYSERPQLSQVYLHGFDMQTYPKYIEEHPEDIPEGADKEAFKKYVNATHDYLKKQGAFQHISTGLSAGDEIEFIIDEELNNRAGTPVILMQATGADGQKHIIGSLPTAVEIGSRTNYTTIVNGKKVRRTKDKTLAEERPGVKALYDKVMASYEEWKKGDKSQPFSGGKTKVSSLMGGVLPLSNTESTVADIFEGTGQTPVIAVADENGSPSRFKGKELDSPLMDPESAVQGQVYVMIPTSTGKYLPALAYSTPLSQLGQSDWYIQQILGAIKDMPKNMRDLQGASHNLYKLLHIPGLSVQIGVQGKKAWTNSNDLTEATHLRLSYSNPKNPDKPSVSLIPMTNGEMSEDDIWKAVNGLIKAYPNTTTSVDINRLGDSEEDSEYRRNIANYLSTNLVKGQVHSVNDWFTYEPTSEEKVAAGREKLKGLGEEPNTGKGGKRKAPSTIDEMAEANTAAEREGIEVKGLEGIDLGQDSGKEDKELGGLAFLARGEEDKKSTFTARRKPNVFGPRKKRLEVSRTNDKVASRKQIAQDIETVRRLFPELSHSNAIVLVRGLINTVNEKGDPVKAYGELRDGVLYISDQSPAGTAFHEAFHYITDTLMTPKERELMFKAAQDRYGVLPRMELEERLAEDFRDYMNGYQGSTGVLKRIYQKLKQIINSIMGRTNYLDSMFYDIYNGSMSSRGAIADNDSFERDFPKYRNNKLSYSNLDQETREFLDQRTTQAEYDSLSMDGKEDTLQCII